MTNLVLQPSARIEISAGQKRYGLVGAIVGGLVGFGFAQSQSCDDGCGTGRAIVTGLGALSGLVVGSIIHTERWRPIVSPDTASPHAAVSRRHSGS